MIYLKKSIYNGIKSIDVFFFFLEGCLQPDPSLRMSVFETLKLIERIKEMYKVNIEPLDINKLKSEGKPIEHNIGSNVPSVPPQPKYIIFNV